MKRALLIAVLIRACTLTPAYAQDHPAVHSAPPRVQYAAWAWTQAYLSESDKGELVGMRIAVNARLWRSLYLGGRLDVSRTQDGGTVNLSDPSSFRDVEPTIALRYDVLPWLGVAGVVGTTFSIEGDDGPADPRQMTYAGGLRIGDNSGGAYGYLLLGKHEPAGEGLKAILSGQVPISDTVSVVADVALSPSSDLMKGAFMRGGIAVRSPWP